MSELKREVRRLSDAYAPERRKWLERAAFFHDEDLLYLKFLITLGARVLELGCGTGDLLAALQPSFGVGVDFSEGMVAQARAAHPGITFLVGDIEDAAFFRSLPGPFDAIVVVDALGALDDCQAMFESLRALCTRETRDVTDPTCRRPTRLRAIATPGAASRCCASSMMISTIGSRQPAGPA